MTRSTDVHGYTVPETGDTDYDTTFDGLFDDWDADIIIRGASADRPSNPPSGTVFLDETNDVLEEYDGNNWTIRAGLGSASKTLPKVTLTDLEATSSLIDASGTTHSGELADLADVRTDEELEDLVDALVAAGANLSWTYDDAGGTLRIETTALNEEEVEDAINALVSAGDKLSWTYDDANDDLQIDTSALDEEEVEDAVAAMLTGGTNATVSYDDANDTLTVSVDSHASSHEKGGADPVLTFGDTTHDSVTVDAGDVQLDNAQWLQGKDGNASVTQLIGVTAGGRVLVGDVAGNGLVTALEANGTVGIEVQTTGNVTVENGELNLKSHDITNAALVDTTELNLGLENKSGDFTTSSSATHYSVDTFGGDVTATLATPGSDAILKNLKRRGSGTLTLDTAGSATIEGETSIDLTQDEEAISVIYNPDDDNWEVW